MKNNKRKNVNIKNNKPMFILIGLVAMILIVAIIYYVFLRYSPEQIITYKGFAIEGKTMAENLKSEETENIEKYLNLIEVHENDLLYKRLNSYYIGEGDKKEIDINYPMYINDGNTLFNLSRNTKLITVNYEEVEGYPDFMLTGGVMYNGGDLTRADGNQYLFIKSEDDIYTNVQKINIKTSSNEYEIKEYSNIYFTENAVTYYEMQDGYMQYKKISDIDNNSEISINGETLTYKTFLEKLGVIQSEKESTNDNKNEEVNEIEETNTVNNETQLDEENNNNINNETTNEWQEGMWAKPEVSCTDFESDVYTIRTNLTVTDRANVITIGIVFEVSLDGRLNRRVQATKTGELEITGLQPDTTYEIVGIVYYNDENGVEQEEEFYTGSVTTKSIDTLGTIDFSFQNGTIYSNKIELIHLKINNDINEEVIKGISRLQLEIDGIEYRLTNDQVNQIKEGKEITYQTSETVKSNSKIKYEITAFDKFGNELKEMNNTGETITSKQVPTASIRATKQDVTEVNLEVTLTNRDNVTIENYRYEILNQSGEKVKEGILNENSSSETLVFTDLDPNGYYQIIIYGDYDLENGEGKHENQELGRGSFVTRPIASLGYIRVNIDDKEVTQNEIKLGVSIDSNQTDARLIAILDKVEVVVYDEGKNINQGNSETDEQVDNEIKRITLSEEEVEQLKTAEEVELQLDQLTSNTIYKIDVITTVKQGTVEEVVEDKQNIDQVITLKMPAEVQIRNQFVIGDMIDLDIRVEDLDNAVLTENVRIEVRDEENKLVNLSEMATNGDYERKTYENLEPNTTYRIIVYAPQYNEGSTDATYEADYILKEIKIVTEAGISGKLDLLSLEKTPAGKNLIDVSSKVNWYQKCFNTGVHYGINYNEESKTLLLGDSNTQYPRYYYDLTKYIGQEVTISFKAKSDNSIAMWLLQKNTSDFTSDLGTGFMNIYDLTSEWKEYSKTFTVNESGYVGFQLNVPTEGIVEIQDLQIELGNAKTDYEEFRYTYNANMNITVNDVRDEITTNDYYIRIYKNNEQIEEYRYEELGEENKIENVLKTYELDSDTTYKIELLVKVADRYYELDSQDFTTEGTKEIKGISDANDFLKIQPYGEYIVLSDIDLSGASGYTYRFGHDDLQFEGIIDFNGKTLIRDLKSTNSTIFYNVGTNGLIENMVLDIDMNNDIEVNGAEIISTNNGTIKNMQINLIDCKENLNMNISFITNYNHGIIENFVINLQNPLYVDRGVGLLAKTNYGTIKNGYLYGENIKVLNSKNNSNAQAAGIANNNSQNGIIQNIYSLVNIDNVYNNEYNKYVGNIVQSNNNNATVQNVYSVGIGENYSDFGYGPNIHTKNSKKVYNNYYFTDEIFTSELESKGNLLSLWDSEFQNQLINSDGAFIVDDLVAQGYYPHLNMPDVMPLQEYIDLPAVEDADLPDILSTKILEQGTNTVKVEFSVNNPSAETINNIQIENLDVEIISQEYNSGKSTVIAELKNPVVCVSSYDVLSITTKGAFGSTYTRDYDEGERVINVDLYREIWSVQDWKNIANSTTENYMLMTDLDFINEGNSVRLLEVDGIIDGNGHSISNINLTQNIPLINNLLGTLKNIYIYNYNQVATSDGGLIRLTHSGSVVDGVHIDGGIINKTGGEYAGVLVRQAMASTIKNCSINNVVIDIKSASSLNTLYFGGFVGYFYSTNIENCYIKGLQITDTKAVNSAIGAIAGYGFSTNSLRNCYAEGKIISENLNVGGIAGSFDSNIENCYSKVDISASNNGIGGILGIYTGSDISTINNNLSIGSMYTTSGIDNLNRIVGNSTETTRTNYSYDRQLLNGYISSEQKGATLLNKEELLNLDLGDSYNYDEKDNEVLPKLYNTEGTVLLPNQEDIYLDDNTTGEETTAELEIESTEATKPNTTEAEINIRINNPEEVEITGITIEDMNTTITRNVTQNGITSITVRATPNRYYDSYKLIGITYKDNISEEEQVKEVEAEIDIQFYKEIYTYEDWQSIEDGTYQNYRLMADIDFSGKTNIKNNITVNRLEAENQIYTLKNITLDFNMANTGLINNVKTSMKNIGFENITLNNTAGSGNYFGIISSNNGNIQNLRFKDIIINSPGITYAGIIGGENSGNIENIELTNITVNGNHYVGGLVGYTNLDVATTISDITGENITINGEGNRIGGMFGYIDVNNNVKINNISLNNSNITGKDYTGGIAGTTNYGELNYFEIQNSTVNGNSYVGGICGYLSNGSSSRGFYKTISTMINGEGSYIGGIAGYVGSNTINYLYVDNCTINAPSVNSQNVGGAFGDGSWINVRSAQVTNSEIISNGTNIGGIGNSVGSDFTNVERSYVKNTSIKGNRNVGGIYGYFESGNIIYNYVEADVQANSNSAGGIIGYLENSNMTAASSITTVHTNLVLNTTVTAQSKVGGLIGDIAKEIYRDRSYYYDNYIDADVTSENESTGSLIIGGRPDENEYITNTYVYRYSTLNGDYVYASDDKIDDDQLLVRADLDVQSTFQNKVGLGTTYFDYTSLQEGKYPTIKDEYLYLPELQTGVDLPTDPSIVDLNAIGTDDENDTTTTEPNSNDISTQRIEALPEVKVYPISVNEINIDFSSIPENISFTYYINGSEIETVNLTEKTYTFEYNFEDELEIVVTNGVDEETVTIDPSDIRSEISLVGENYAYLNGNKLYINGEVQSGEYVNLYDGLAMLRNSSQILDVSSRQIVESNLVETSLEETAKPLNTYDYKDNSIEAYGTYSKINGNIKLQIYNVRNGKLSAIANNVDMKIANSISDNYNNKEYQTILSSQGELIDLKEKLQYPDGFFSRNIKQIVQNTDQEKTEIMLIYNTGKVMVFNYVTGDVIFETNEKADEGLSDYIAGSISNIWSDYEDRQVEYAKSQELVSKLEKLPIDEALNEKNSEKIENNVAIENNYDIINTDKENSNVMANSLGDNYITVYDEDAQEYEVYSENEIIDGTEQEPVSETTKIKLNGLEGLYNSTNEKESQVNGAVIVLATIAIAMISLVILRKLVYIGSRKAHIRKAFAIKTKKGRPEYMNKAGKPCNSRERERERVTLNNIIFGKRVLFSIIKYINKKRIDYKINIFQKNIYNDIVCPFCV